MDLILVFLLKKGEKLNSDVDFDGEIEIRWELGFESAFFLFWKKTMKSWHFFDLWIK